MKGEWQLAILENSRGIFKGSISSYNLSSICSNCVLQLARLAVFHFLVGGFYFITDLLILPPNSQQKSLLLGAYKENLRVIFGDWFYVSRISF